MDILISSNLERLLFHLTDGDSARVAGWMKSLNDTGRYEVDAETLAQEFPGLSQSVAQVLHSVDERVGKGE